jgi:hypothetical protein
MSGEECVSKSLERRLFDAYASNRGIKLTAEDVWSLVNDDAVATRITNAACIDAGIDEVGADCVRYGKTWDELKAFLKKDAGWYG